MSFCSLGAVLARSLDEADTEFARVRFERAVSDLRGTLSGRLAGVGESVRSLAALLAASSSVSTDELRSFVSFADRAGASGRRAEFCVRLEAGRAVVDPPLGPDASAAEREAAADPFVAELALRSITSGRPETAVRPTRSGAEIVVAHPVQGRDVAAAGVYDARAVFGGARDRTELRELEFRIDGPGGEGLFSTGGWDPEARCDTVRHVESLGMSLGLQVIALHSSEFDPASVLPWFALAAGAGLGAASYRGIRGLVTARERAVAESRAQREAADAVRASEESAREIAEYYRVLFDDAPEPMWLYDELDFRFVAVNREAVRVYGWSSDEFLAKSVLDIRPPDDAARLKALVNSGLPDSDSRDGRHLTRDGRVLDVVVSTRRIRTGGRNLRAVVVRDVTHQMRLEAQFRQAQKMEAVGLLAGGVAHDFNNMLSIVLGYSEMLRHSVPAGTARDQLAEIIAASERASELTRKLLTFSRTQEVSLRAVDAGAVIRGLGKMVRRIVPETIDVRIDVAGGLPAVVADPGALEQAVLNLVVNARDAMAAGGVLTISVTATATASLPGRLMSPPPPSARTVVVAVSDTGTGIEAAVLERIFEPFFTTKPVGRGTGLGLSTVYAIVRKLGGGISVDSAPGRGAAFRIALEATDAVPEPELGAPAGADDSRAPQLRVLVAEDHDGVRDVLYQLLRRAGHQVLAAASGEQAIALATTMSGALDVVVADVVLPRIDGPGLVGRIREIHPGVRAVFVSGHPEEEIRPRIRTEPAATLLRKPVDSRALLTAVRGEPDAAA